MKLPCHFRSRSTSASGNNKLGKSGRARRVTFFVCSIRRPGTVCRRRYRPRASWIRRPMASGDDERGRIGPRDHSPAERVGEEFCGFAPQRRVSLTPTTSRHVDSEPSSVSVLRSSLFPAPANSSARPVPAGRSRAGAEKKKPLRAPPKSPALPGEIRPSSGV